MFKIIGTLALLLFFFQEYFVSRRGRVSRDAISESYANGGNANGTPAIVKDDFEVYINTVVSVAKCKLYSGCYFTELAFPSF